MLLENKFNNLVMDADAKKFLIIQVIWIGISLAISIALSFLLPFQLSIIAVIAVIILLFNFAIRRRQIRKMGYLEAALAFLVLTVIHRELNIIA